MNRIFRKHDIVRYNGNCFATLSHTSSFNDSLWIGINASGVEVAVGLSQEINFADNVQIESFNQAIEHHKKHELKYNFMVGDIVTFVSNSGPCIAKLFEQHPADDGMWTGIDMLDQEIVIGFPKDMRPASSSEITLFNNMVFIYKNRDQVIMTTSPDPVTNTINGIAIRTFGDNKLVAWFADHGEAMEFASNNYCGKWLAHDMSIPNQPPFTQQQVTQFYKDGEQMLATFANNPQPLDDTK